MKKTIYFLNFAVLSALLILLQLACCEVFSQGWERTYGGNLFDEGRYVRQTADGGYIVVGGTKSFAVGYQDMYLLKISPLGDTLWTKNYPVNNTVGSANTAYYVQQTTDGGYIVAGSNLIKTDAFGNALWQKNTFGSSVRQTTDGGYIIASHNMPSWNIKTEACLLKTDANGDTLWMKSFGGGSWDYFFDALQTTDGGYIATGNTYSFGAGDADVYLVKTDASGNALWTKTFGGTKEDASNCIRQTSDGGYIVVGYTQSIDSGYRNIYLIKTDANGNAVWKKNYGGGIWQNGKSVEQTSTGNFIIAGNKRLNGNSDEEAFLLKVNSNGDILWTKSFGGTCEEYFNSVQQTTNGGYIMAGISCSFSSGNYDIYLVKTDSEGNICTPTPFSQNPVICFGDSIAVGSNTYFISGIYIDTLTNFYGCDSIVTTDLTVIIPSKVLLEIPSEPCDISLTAEIQEQDKNLFIFPNPSDGTFTIQTSTTPTQINIYNTLGEKISAQPPMTNDLMTIDISNFSKGIYFLEIISDEKRENKKIILN